MLNKDEIYEFLYEALETEKGGVQIYEVAIDCALNDDLRSEWEEYLEQTENHVSVLTNVLQKLGLNPDQETPGRLIVRHNGLSLVRTIQMALINGKPIAAQIVAAECIVLAETQDHSNWQMIGMLADQLTGTEQEALKNAFEQVEDEEDEHLYHTMGWCRELRLQSFGLPATLPPAEEQQDVRTEMDEAQTKKQRKEELRGAATRGRR
jgi:rubrerythrin